MLATILSYLDEHYLTIIGLGFMIVFYIYLSTISKPTNRRTKDKRYFTAYLLIALISLFYLIRSLIHFEITSIVGSSLLLLFSCTASLVEYRKVHASKNYV